ncbi:hypothetical protein OG369_20655 [Streptomyces sp. NBC_01221]|nr:MULTISPECIES: hypothetical protein [unclassified Streptomyces]MCX4788491.1 hypothetical protein [Streptomyces sp. NBC_01221]WSJ37036.1 hypothetical protein OG772_13970 [Streptomyces sp. NBC_01321]
MGEVNRDGRAERFTLSGSTGEDMHGPLCVDNASAARLQSGVDP